MNQTEPKEIQEPTPENLILQLTEANRLKDEYLAGWQRTKADFANYQKNELDRAKEVLEFAKAAWLINLLAVYDNFERAQQHLSGDLANSEWAKGVIQIQNQFENFLKEQGVEEIEALGQKFNPAHHEALGTLENSGQEADIIIEVLEKGYRLNGQLLRPSKVKIAK